MSSPHEPPPPLMPLRTAVVLGHSTTIGSATGILAHTESGTSGAALAAMSVFAGAVLFFHKVIGP